MQANPDRLTVVSLSLPAYRFTDYDDVDLKLTRLRDDATRLTGVTAATVSESIPPYLSFQAAGDLETSASYLHSEQPVGVAMVDETFLPALEVPALKGRGFDGTERRGTLAVGLVSRTLAASLWPGEDPIGKQLRLSAGDPWLTVSGVTGDVRNGGFETPLGEMTVFVRGLKAIETGILGSSP